MCDLAWGPDIQGPFLGVGCAICMKSERDAKSSMQVLEVGSMQVLQVPHQSKGDAQSSVPPPLLVNPQRALLQGWVSRGHLVPKGLASDPATCHFHCSGTCSFILTGWAGAMARGVFQSSTSGPALQKAAEQVMGKKDGQGFPPNLCNVGPQVEGALKPH